MRSTLLATAIALSAVMVLAADRIDFDGNGSVDFDDFFLFAAGFGARQGDARFDAKFDLDGAGAGGGVAGNSI